jgi:hypothetical protein
MTNAWPLAWPPGWPRTPRHKRQDSKYRFKRQGSLYAPKSDFWTFAAARNEMISELERIGARSVVLSTNYELRLDGLPRSSGPTPDDTGVAIYFQLAGKPMVMACDMHQRAEENMRSITLALEAMRQLKRHGGGMMMERAFAGFAALAPPRSCWDVLGLRPGAPRSEVERAWRMRVKEAHPDLTGGSHDAIAEINRARDEALLA